jgi:hypothetical protein
VCRCRGIPRRTGREQQAVATFSLKQPDDHVNRVEVSSVIQCCRLSASQARLPSYAAGLLKLSRSTWPSICTSSPSSQITTDRPFASKTAGGLPPAVLRTIHRRRLEPTCRWFWPSPRVPQHGFHCFSHQRSVIRSLLFSPRTTVSARLQGSGTKLSGSVAKKRRRMMLPTAEQSVISDAALIRMRWWSSPPHGRLPKRSQDPRENHG